MTVMEPMARAERAREECPHTNPALWKEGRVKPTWVEQNGKGYPLCTCGKTLVFRLPWHEHNEVSTR